MKTLIPIGYNGCIATLEREGFEFIVIFHL